VQILGSKCWALGGLNQKIEENSFVNQITIYIAPYVHADCRGARGEVTAKKWLDSIKKQKGRSNLKERDKQTDMTKMRDDAISNF